MTIRWLVVAVLFIVALPVAVFLRPAMADPPPQVVIVKVCNIPVVVYTIDKGIGTFYIMEELINHEEEMKKIAKYLQFGNVLVYKGEKWLGLNCPVQM